MCYEGPMRGRLPLVVVLAVLVLPASLPCAPCMGYTPHVGHWARYDYGFVCTQWNLSEIVIGSWTGLSLPRGNYTMLWHQYVNLTIAVISIPLIGVTPYGLYNISVQVHSNQVTVSNSTWQTTLILNASIPAPAPTGIESGLVLYPAGLGLPSFLLDDFTLAALHPGVNVTIGGGIWSSITLVTLQLGGDEETCYLLHNVTTTPISRIETSYTIEADSGLYIHANETQTYTYEENSQKVTYYYNLLSTNIPLMPSPPSPLPLLLVTLAIAVVIIAFLLFLLIRRRRRRRPLQLLTSPDSLETTHPTRQSQNAD